MRYPGRGGKVAASPHRERGVGAAARSSLPPAGPKGAVGQGSLHPGATAGDGGRRLNLPQENKPDDVSMRCPNAVEEVLSAATAVFETSIK